ncbi:MAG: hypothetical protein IJ842_03585 [Bacilli bacterium]|nr:hypothetical protein [Bacilli bacterium]
MKRKLVLVLLVFVVLFTITGCGSKTSSKWEYSKEDFASFSDVFSDKALNQEDSDIDIIYVHDIKLSDNISKEDILVFNYDDLEEDLDYENKYVSYELIKKYQINVEKIDIKSEPGTLRVYFYGEDDLFINYGVLINKDVSKDQKYIITKTQKEYLGNDEDYDGLENITFAPLFQYLDAHGISMEQIIEDGVITETIAEMFANNDNMKLSNVSNLISYLGCDVKDVMKYEKSGVHEVAHEIDWNTDTVKKQDYESKGFITFKPLLHYISEHNYKANKLIFYEGLFTATEFTRIKSDHNFRVSMVNRLCNYFKIDVSDVIEFVEN